MLRRLENTVRDSNIRAVITYTGDGCGSLGPRCEIQEQRDNLQEIPRDELASFLNRTTGRDGNARQIDANVESGIVSDFADVLQFKDGRYIYVGPLSHRAAPVYVGSLRHQDSPLSSLVSSCTTRHPVFQSGAFVSKYTGVLAKNVVLPNFKANTKVLDVGAGDGYMTQRLRDELNCDAFALEPNIEVKQGYESCVARLGGDHAFNLTLEEAVTKYPDKFIGQYDAITVFKYNIDCAIKGLC